MSIAFVPRAQLFHAGASTVNGLVVGSSGRACALRQPQSSSKGGRWLWLTHPPYSRCSSKYLPLY